MSHRLNIYKLQVVKEKSVSYEINKIATPLDAATIFGDSLEMKKETEEVMQMLVLNTRNIIIGSYEISRGSLNSSIVHPREVFKRAIASNASSIIIAHNHPSGDTSPSSEDIAITKRLIECGKLLGIEVLDHIIIGEYGYTSLKEQGLL